MFYALESFFFSSSTKKKSSPRKNFIPVVHMFDFSDVSQWFLARILHTIVIRTLFHRINRIRCYFSPDKCTNSNYNHTIWCCFNESFDSTGALMSIAFPSPDYWWQRHLFGFCETQHLKSKQPVFGIKTNMRLNVNTKISQIEKMLLLPRLRNDWWTISYFQKASWLKFGEFHHSRYRFFLKVFSNYQEGCCSSSTGYSNRSSSKISDISH